MPDWRKFVRERLPELSGTEAMDEAVVRELAEHLEDVYTELRASGMTQHEAARHTRRQVGSWLDLRRGIHSARREEAMNQRVARFWLPSLVTLLLGWGVLTILIWAGTRPFMTHPAEARGLIIYVPWLVMLPLVGAAGGYLARRSNASGWRVYVAGTFPAIAIAIVFLLILPWAFMIDPEVVPSLKLTSFAALTLSWIVLPGSALCLGVALQGIQQGRWAKH